MRGALNYFDPNIIFSVVAPLINFEGATITRGIRTSSWSIAVAAERPQQCDCDDITMTKDCFFRVQVQAMALCCIQRNVRRFLEIRSWPWWRLFVKIAPVLNVHRTEEQLKSTLVSAGPPDPNAVENGACQCAVCGRVDSNELGKAPHS